MGTEISKHKERILKCLEPDENIIEMVYGMFENDRLGIMALTRKRILRYAEWEGFWGKKKSEYEQFPLSEILVVREFQDSTLAGTFQKIQFNTYSANFEIHVHWGDLDNFVRLAKSLITEQKNTETNQPMEAEIPSQIKKLAELRDEGIITDEEFMTKKRNLLSRM